MNIILNPEQFLKIYTTLVINQSIEMVEVKNKMESIILEALSTINNSNNQLKFFHWIEKEKEKIVELENKLKLIKTPDNPRLKNVDFQTSST